MKKINAHVRIGEGNERKIEIDYDCLIMIKIVDASSASFVHPFPSFCILLSMTWLRMCV